MLKLEKLKSWIESDDVICRILETMFDLEEFKKYIFCEEKLFFSRKKKSLKFF